ncbi:PREDICTED: platelet-derived growth factor receptor-like protein [Miniopterus natalensis]|uniref:platelet-derived growth factor receptor-like protein n=1 Tax=Miniopterus natalensis TaxID=291302 RepID=UPI0007A6EBD6|nr:PREDICTED: platelet-derived growth factor receptor-like protein [Miniopterus natalensis]
MDPRTLCILSCCLLICVISAEIQERGRAPKAQKKAVKAASPGEMKPPGAPGRRKPKSDRRQKSLQMKTPVEAAAPSPQTPSILTQVLGRGHFQKVGDSLSLRAGEPLELRCPGKVVHWRVPVYLEEEGEGRLRIKHFSQHSRLQLVNSTGADTGEYSCWARDCRAACTEGRDRQGRAFIFFTDPEELFVPTENYYEVVQLRSHQPALLPCQVTNPLAQVTLHREFPPEEVPVDGTDISFDVKKGFTIHRPRASLAGSLFCLASLGGLRQISTKYMLIYINYPSSSPKPTIQASATSALLGENFNVTCTVLSEPEIVVDFSWEYPGQKMGRPPYVSKWTDVVRKEGQVQQEAGSTLYVEEARAGDAGIYTCRATNLQGTGTATTHVHVTRSPRVSPAPS